MIKGLIRSIEILEEEKNRTVYTEEQCLIEDLIEMLKEEIEKIKD